MGIDFERWDGITGGSLSPAQVVEECLEFGESHAGFADKFVSEGFVQKDLRHWREVEASEGDREFTEADWDAYVDELRRFLIATLDAARPKGTICRKVEVSAQAFEFPADADLESWETVRAGADSVKLVTGLLGRAPYTALYSVLREGRIVGLRHSSYFVAEPTYGIKEFADVLGIAENHFRSNLSRGCGQIPRPALATENGKVWTHSQVETCRQARLLNARQPGSVVVITENSSADPEAKAYLVSHHRSGTLPDRIEHGFDSLAAAKKSVSREYLLRRPVRRDDAAGDVLFIGRLRSGKRVKS